MEEYNITNQTNLIFSDFEEIDWVRTINGNVKLPSSVWSFIWRVIRSRTDNGEAVEIPTEYSEIVECLIIYFNKALKETRPTISVSNLVKVLIETGSDGVSVKYLIDREILRPAQGHNSINYEWLGGKYFDHLRNEVTSTLWLLVGGEEASLYTFRKYLQLIEDCGMWFDDLQTYLTQANTNRIRKLAFGLLKEENDLLKSTNEFRKIWLDSSSHSHVNVLDPVPVLKFDYQTPIKFIDSVKNNKQRFQGAFDFQGTRSFCHTLLRFIIVLEPEFNREFNEVTSILKDTSRPSLLWICYSDIQRRYPETFPYLLIDTEIAPFAFQLIDKIEIPTSVLTYDNNTDVVFKEECEKKDEIWLEMFHWILNGISKSQSELKEKGELIGRILIDLANSVFYLQYNASRGSISHNILKKRYAKVLSALANVRVSQGNVYPSSPIAPHFIFLILPDLVIFYTNQSRLPHTGFNALISLSSGYLDLGIELLKLLSTKPQLAELTNSRAANIANSKADLIGNLKSQLLQYYTETELEVYAFDDSEFEKKSIIRGYGEFGFEIIDWAHLYLQFELFGELEPLHDSFAASLILNKQEDKNAPQNKEQRVKIKMFIKSLSIAFISIHKEPLKFELKKLPVRTTLEKLERFISSLALKYSVEDISNGTVDAFESAWLPPEVNLYTVSAISLLFQSVTQFPKTRQIHFAKEFFKQRNDISQMLAAINILETKEVKDIINQRIKDIEIKDFASSGNLTQVQSALIESINSEGHWKLAKPLLEQTEEYLKRTKGRVGV
ncbi:MAG: hypothetical protein JKX84_08885 [Flavobacteriales bacterium]|nr:hypothetical protein [Flavobacteriales bacterium]